MSFEHDICTLVETYGSHTAVAHALGYQSASWRCARRVQPKKAVILAQYAAENIRLRQKLLAKERQDECIDK